MQQIIASSLLLSPQNTCPTPLQTNEPQGGGCSRQGRNKTVESYPCLQTGVFDGEWGETPGLESQRGCQHAGAADGVLEKLEPSEINPGTRVCGWQGRPHFSAGETKARQGRALLRASE